MVYDYPFVPWCCHRACSLELLPFITVHSDEYLPGGDSSDEDLTDRAWTDGPSTAGPSTVGPRIGPMVSFPGYFEPSDHSPDLSDDSASVSTPTDVTSDLSAVCMESFPEFPDAISIPERPLSYSFKMTVSHESTYSYTHTHTNMSTELLDYLPVTRPFLGDRTGGKTGLHLTHHARISGGRIEMHNALKTSDNSLVHKVLRNMSLMRGLAFAFKLDMSCIYDDSPENIISMLRRAYAETRDSKQKINDAREAMWDLVIFVMVALAVMAALHEDTARSPRRIG
ncbi:hypothetical protein FRC11_007584 [Ceratobasidium sp. 423]|nr:hypothetical protein FRC11_007584 [Ceratobasidium sp. 423]